MYSTAKYHEQGISYGRRYFQVIWRSIFFHQVISAWWRIFISFEQQRNVVPIIRTKLQANTCAPRIGAIIDVRGRGVRRNAARTSSAGELGISNRYFSAGGRGKLYIGVRALRRHRLLIAIRTLWSYNMHIDVRAWRRFKILVTVDARRRRNLVIAVGAPR